MKFFIINGPNLNMLGVREPMIYGRTTYAELTEQIRKYCSDNGVQAEIFQSNHEGDLVDLIQKAYFESADGIVLNPGAYTHTSIALADALKAVNLPTVEVHLSDVNRREAFRQISYIRDICIATISGHGTPGYTEAIAYLTEYCRKGGKKA